MRAVLQRVRSARVEVGGVIAGAIESGILVLLGIARGDTEADADHLIDKIVNLRIFEDMEGRMNLSVQDRNGALLVVSQFTVYGDCSRGRRPSFDQAAPASEARRLYQYFVDGVRGRGTPIQAGVFQAMMTVHLVNDGPVTLICDSPMRK